MSYVEPAQVSRLEDIHPGQPEGNLLGRVVTGDGKKIGGTDKKC